MNTFYGIIYHTSLHIAYNTYSPSVPAMMRVMRSVRWFVVHVLNVEAAASTDANSFSLLSMKCSCRESYWSSTVPTR